MIELNIPAIHCGGCAKTVTRLVGEIDPAARVDIDVDSKRVSIETDASRDAIVARLAEAGFEPA